MPYNINDFREMNCPMLLRLVLVLTIVPVVELMLLLELAERFSWRITLALVVLTGVLGAYLARRQGLKTAARIQAELEAGTVPAGALLDGALILAAGLVLVTPGILTDLVGFALLIPPVRRSIGRRIGEALKNRMIVIQHGPADDFVDVTATSRNVENQIGNGDE